MKTETVDTAGLREALREIRDELNRLGERIALLETGRQGDRETGAAPPVAQAQPEGLSEELVLVISAAIAAFLGKKPHIRQIRLLGTTAWMQQGRVLIQASHTLSVRHTRSPH